MSSSCKFLDWEEELHLELLWRKELDQELEKNRGMLLQAGPKALVDDVKHDSCSSSDLQKRWKDELDQELARKRVSNAQQKIWKEELDRELERKRGSNRMMGQPTGGLRTKTSYLKRSSFEPNLGENKICIS